MNASSPDKTGRRLAASLSVYRVFLRAYPSAFRRRCGLQMEDAFAADWHRAMGAGGGRGFFLFWGRTLFDVIRTAVPERLGRSGGTEGGRRGTPGVRPHRRSVAHDLGRDLRYAVRTLGRTPAFSAVAVVILALGIGANTTIFTVVNALFFDTPPDVVEPERLVRVYRSAEYTQSGALSYPDYEHYRDNNDVFTNMFAYDRRGVALTAGHGAAVHPIRGWFVSASYFDVLGTRPALGRMFLPHEDATPGSVPVAVLSHRFWATALGADSSLVGTTLTLNGHPFTIVGIAPSGFRGISPIESPPEVWVPITMRSVVSPAGGDVFHRVPGEVRAWTWAVGRLRPGVTVEQARANVSMMGDYLADNFAAWNEGESATVAPNWRFHPPAATTLLTLSRLLLAVVAVVLLIASANMAILLLARASVRTKEIAVRVALGAGRGRIVRQLLAESLLLGLAGGAAGYLVAFWTADIAATMIPFVFAVDFRPDLSVLGVAVALAVGTAVVFGLAPALQASRTDAATVIKEGSGGRGRSTLRRVLVVGQISLSILLVTGAVLFGRSLRSARAVELGFETEDRLLVSVNLRNHGYSSEAGLAFFEEALGRVQSVPGVVNAGLTTMIPFHGVWQSGFSVPGVEGPGGDGRFDALFNSVGPNYFRTMGMQMIQGREFVAGDNKRAPPMVVINERLARQVWPDDDALGRTITAGGQSAVVVGVVNDAVYRELGEDPPGQIFVAALQDNGWSGTFVVHTSGPPMSWARAVQDAIHIVDPHIAIALTTTMTSVLDDEIGRYRVSATLVTVLGVLALALASVGLYGVLSYLVVQRTREIGIRVALGANHRTVAGEVLWVGLRLAGVGIVLGSIGALVATRFVGSFLYGVRAWDPATFVAAPMTLVVVAGLASVLPASRAARIVPLAALKTE